MKTNILDKILSDGTSVSSDIYYQALEWRDANLTLFNRMTNKHSLRELNKDEFDKICKYANITNLKL